jgi:hypothetical protein
MRHYVITPPEQIWETRPHADGEPARHVADSCAPALRTDGEDADDPSP